MADATDNANDNDKIAQEITGAATDLGFVGLNDIPTDAAHAARALAWRTGISQDTAARLVERLGSDDPEKLDAAAQLTKRPR